MQRDKIMALMMAAGYSRRFGAADKRDAVLGDGRSLLIASLANARGTFSSLRVVVREEDAPTGIEECALIRVKSARHGLGASIGEAFGALLEDPSVSDIQAAAVLLGDMPYIQRGTFTALMDMSAPNIIVSPSLNERSGHPVLFGRDFWPALARLSGGEGARAVLQANAAHHRVLPVDDAGIAMDIDCPADLPRS
ncbi:nucleotidyltransferase family protein [Halomonas sp. PAMB 3264]|uniref:nucleotidyltransferase family protein n=1 Tax=Halomonas sp. PAMB 3264 TaxID=3075222 RepID=UPI00289B2429|nr:nucleotidyltransferase family protein [Halomonas sp. PAMB 3264]WNL42481.1 nucleotidyltransferase family protein [Halomonas sp. PAMB 3264]